MVEGKKLCPSNWNLIQFISRNCVWKQCIMHVRSGGDTVMKMLGSMLERVIQSKKCGRDIQSKETACVKILLESRNCPERRVQCSFQCDYDKESGELNGVKESPMLSIQVRSDYSSFISHFKDLKFLSYGTLEDNKVSLNDLAVAWQFVFNGQKQWSIY